jgi:hypothetical protein
MTTVPARVAAPSPTVENAAFATKTAGTVKTLGIHESRQPGFRRNANARMSGARSENAAVKPDSILWARDCHETLSHAASIPWQSRWKMPSKNVEMPFGDQHGCADATDDIGTERAPQAEAEQDYEDAGEVRSDLVVDPGARSRLCAEVRDVIVRHAVRGWLRQTTRDPSDVERHECEQATSPGDARWHV